MSGRAELPRKPTLNYGQGVPRDGNSRSSQILVDATRDFSMVKRPPAIEIDQYKELFYQFIDRLKPSQRRLVSAILARSNFTPRAVALYLAQDVLEVAAPLLLFSPVLTDLDLRAIASKNGKPYADVIRRRQLPMEQFTAQALDRKQAKTQQDEPAKKSGNESSISSDEVVSLAGIGGKLGRNKPNLQPAKTKLSDHRPVAVQDTSLPKRELRQLQKLARKQDKAGFANLVEELCGLEPTATLRLIGASKGEEALYLIRALGVKPPYDLQIGLMLLPHIGRSLDNYRSAKATLAELEPGICKMIFNEIGAKFVLERGRAENHFNTIVRQPPNPELNMRSAMQERRRAVFDERNTASEPATDPQNMNIDREKLALTG